MPHSAQSLSSPAEEVDPVTRQGKVRCHRHTAMTRSEHGNSVFPGCLWQMHDNLIVASLQQDKKISEKSKKRYKTWKTAGWGSGSLRCIKTDLWKERRNAVIASVLSCLQE
jgi:hypothetical protein